MTIDEIEGFKEQPQGLIQQTTGNTWINYVFSPGVDEKYGRTIQELSEKPLGTHRIFSELKNSEVNIFKKVEEHSDPEYETPIETAKYFFMTPEEANVMSQYLQGTEKII